MPPETTKRISLAERRREGWAALKAFLFPGKAEEDPGFKAEIRRLSVRGLYTVAGVTAIMPLLGLLFHALSDLYEPIPMVSPILPVSLLTLAGITLGLARTDWGREHARPLAFAAGILVATILIWGTFLDLRATQADPVLSSLIDLILVLVVAITAIPARPMQMFAFGWGIAWINFVSSILAARYGLIPQPSLHYYAAFDLIVLLCIVLAGLNYQLLYRTYVAQLDRLTSHARLLNSETAVSFSRLSATLSHELNSPLGALASSIESLKSLKAKQQSSQALDPKRTYRIQEDLLDSAEKAVETLAGIASRIQRFTNLDRAETTKVHIDKMLQDVAQMVSPSDADATAVRLTTQDVPAVTLKPQPISAVFSRLLQNALRANPEGETVEVHAYRRNSDVIVRVLDHGEGLSDRDLRELFEPGFRTRGSRVGASNWGLFTARQIVREHGGDILAERAEGGGTAVIVQLPLDGPTTLVKP